MRFFAPHSNPQNHVPLHHWKGKLLSACGPVLAIAGLILSAIPDWACILGCAYMGYFIVVPFLSSKNETSLRRVELNDGDVVRLQEGSTLSLIRLRPWGWARPSSLDLACYGSHRKIHLRASDGPPATLRRIARYRIHGLKHEAERNSVVQTPVATRLWL